ncbi:MAG: hypothetical protein ACTHXX_12510, partial [Staphylococcus equorum]
KLIDLDDVAIGVEVIVTTTFDPQCLEYLKKNDYWLVQLFHLSVHLELKKTIIIIFFSVKNLGNRWVNK